MHRRSQSSSPSSPFASLRTKSSLARSLARSLALSLLVAACGGREPASPELPVTRPPGAAPRITLLTPDSGSVIAQNDASTGCPAHPQRGAGFRLNFDWHDVPGAVFYRVVFWQRDAEFAAVQAETATSDFTEIACNSFVIDRNLQHWRWHVAAYGPAVDSVPDSSAPHDGVLWSELWSWSFAPCRLASGVACNAPPLPPASGATTLTNDTRHE